VALHKAVVGLAAETRLLAAPASVHVLDTSSGQEDVQALTFLAAERVGSSLDALETSIACEVVALRQAAEVRGRPVEAPTARKVVDRLSDALAPVLDDRTLSPDIECARALVRTAPLWGHGRL
jgi:histidine ammonia-lyase